MSCRIRQNPQVIFRAPGKDVSVCQGSSFVSGTFLSWGGWLGVRDTKASTAAQKSAVVSLEIYLRGKVIA